jgi:prepilin-type processing-associated H-X9-DG protein
LVELLVVLATIGVLAALLLPALNRAKLQAQDITCLSQLRQFSHAWIMYADEHEERIPPNNAVYYLSLDTNTWVLGWLDNDAREDWWDNTNTLHLTQSLIAPFLGQSIPVWRCPSDRSTSRFDGRALPRVRSYAMNDYLNSIDRGVPDPWKIIRQTSDMVNPPPSRTYVFIDEREDSIEDCVFGVDMHNATAPILNVPRSSHNGAGTLSFADGHAELRKWRDARTRLPVQKRGPIGITPEYSSWPQNKDVLWLRQRTTGLK